MRILNFLYALSFFGNCACAQPPLEIRGDKITCEKDKAMCVVDGHAILFSGEEKDPMLQTLAADQVTVHFEKEKENIPQKESSHKANADTANTEPLSGMSKIKEAVAMGNIRLTQKDMCIQSDRATYHGADDKVTFYDNVRIKDGKRSYSECKIATYDRAKNTYEIKDKARILLRPHQQGKLDSSLN